MTTAFPADAAPIKLYRHPLSGHSHRAELMLALLDLPHDLIDVDLLGGAHKAPEFLQMNPFGQVPVIDDNGTIIWDSNAILIYLAARYGDTAHWTGQSPQEQAEIQAWLSVAAGPIAGGPAMARLAVLFGAPVDHAVVKDKAGALLAVMDHVLDGRSTLVGDRLTVADVAGYSYIAHAPEGGVSLDPYPNVRAWLAHIEAQPRFVGMQRSPVPEAG
ncbi:MAG: glutathione S-transferase [Marinibacterium sp.]|nr:glutathione S-transferase [Marinibacterium sp.]